MKFLQATYLWVLIGLGTLHHTYGQVPYVKKENFTQLDFPELTSPVVIQHRLDTSRQQLRPGKVVFAGHPGWLGGGYVNYNFSLLTHIAFNRFTLSQTHKNPVVSSPNEVEAGRLVYLAHVSNAACKTLLTVTPDKSMSTIYNESLARQRAAITAILQKMNSLDADGINLDFSAANAFPSVNEQAFHDFVFLLHLRMQEISKQFELVLTLPALNAIPAYQNLSPLQSVVSFFVIEGYDYNEIINPKHPLNRSSKASGNDRSAYLNGPVAPIRKNSKWGLYTIASSVEMYRNLGISADKLVITLPLLAKVWKPISIEDAITLEIQPIDSLVGYMTYKTLRSQKIESITYDTSSQSQLYTIIDQDSGKPLKAWAEDTVSVGRKINWAMSEGLKGVAIWSPSFSDGLPEFWQMMEHKFVITKAQEPIKIRFLPQLETLFFILTMITLFFLAGLLLTITAKGNVILAQQKARITVAILVAASVSVIVTYLFYVGTFQPWLIGGLLGLVFIVLLMVSIRYWQSRQLP